MISLFHDQDRNGCIRRVRGPGSRGKKHRNGGQQSQPHGQNEILAGAVTTKTPLKGSGF
jgi:hypothetical protein